MSEKQSIEFDERLHKLAIGILGLFLEATIFLHYAAFHDPNNHYHLFRVVCRILGNTFLIMDGRSEFFGIAYLFMSISWPVQSIHTRIKMLWNLLYCILFGLVWVNCSKCTTQCCHVFLIKEASPHFNACLLLAVITVLAVISRSLNGPGFILSD